MAKRPDPNLLLAELGEHEMTLPEDVARQAISDRLDEVAARMGVGRRAARNYVTDDVIADLAAEILGTNDGAGSAQANVVSIVAERFRRRRR
jgi:hypothetical protein